jgi:hypothetical protein
MKSIVFLLGIVSLLSFTSIGASQSNENKIATYSFVECKYSQCKATAKSTGKQCKHCVSNDGDSNCWQHK